MKQHITAEQLQELTTEQKQRLADWWQPQPGDLFFRYCVTAHPHIVKGDYNPENGYFHTTECDSDGEYEWEEKRCCLPRLSIGQCIELLEYHGLKNISPVIDCDVITKVEGWDVLVKDRYFKSKELIDTLWETIKEVL